MKTAPQEIPIRDEIYNADKLESYATFLSQSLTTDARFRRGKPLLPRLNLNSRRLLKAYERIAAAVHLKEAISPAAEWLLDNYHVVEDQIREIQQDLPSTYYYELPKITVGELEGYPRIYALALSIIAHTDSQLEIGTIQKFIQSFQRNSDLKIGELWALPISLRIGLIENTRRVADAVLWERDQYQIANTLADQCIAAAGAPHNLRRTFEQIQKRTESDPQKHCSLLAQLAKRLRDQDHHVGSTLELLEKNLLNQNISLEQIVQKDHQIQAANQVTMANIISSMRLLSSLDWRVFFESVSEVHQLLLQDPSHDYSKMDFATRDRYRQVIEDLAKKSNCSESKVTKTALQMSSAQHVGYFLLGPGLKDLRNRLCYRASLSYRMREFLRSHPRKIYFGILCVAILLLESLVFHFASLAGANLGISLLLALLFLIPLSDIAVIFLNLVFSHLLTPQKLPKLDFSSGVPSSSRTLVVIPCMIHDSLSLLRLLERLEIHYLGNKDPQVAFALLTDFSDSDHAVTEDDEKLLQAAKLGIQNLNQKYQTATPQSPSFYLFHRRRLWNDPEKKWMGWERKRGKLHELNRYLRGATDTSFLTPIRNDFLTRVRYVITLDADTHLPRETAHRLIGALSHPLNHAVNDPSTGKVIEGYSILQPRVSMTLESSAQSRFSRIFSGYTGIDPYTTAVSDLYQDLFHEGIYTGKGIYEIDSFERALHTRIPENKVLSHDLLEGVHARVALVTDIEIFDDYPCSYFSYFKRQHRWIRGDWQIASWLFWKIRDSKGQWIPNSLAFLDKWKIFDNLRRSLLAPLTWLSFIAVWLIFPQSALWWSLGLTTIVAFPSLTHATNQILIHGRRVPWTSQFWQPFQDLSTSIAQFLLSLIFLAHQACLQSDAIVRALYRQYVSRHKLLEWVPAARLESERTAQVWQTPYPAWTLLSLSLIGIAIQTPSSLLFCLPFFALWASYPFIASSISCVLPRRHGPLEKNEEKLLREIARKTWHFFESFVTAEGNWLPPDNFQEDPKPVVAYRTSPTNIGVYLLSVISAHDFGFIDAPSSLRRLNHTLATLKMLEMHNGHLLNWYDIKSLSPLPPRYVSTVDSGNLAGHLVAVQMACEEMRDSKILDSSAVRGLADLFAILSGEQKHLSDPTKFPRVKECLQKIKLVHHKLDMAKPQTWKDYDLLFREAYEVLVTVENLSQPASPSPAFDNLRHWTDCGLKQISQFLSLIDTFAPWVSLPETNHHAQALFSSLQSEFNVSILSKQYTAILSKATIPQDLRTLLQKASQDCDDFRNQCQHLASSFKDFRQQMQFGFLLQKDRTVFSIGYNVEESRHDTALYDLLASESRLASFIAIAKGDVPQEHWFRLGRQLVTVSTGRALISWTASMFEYLMPTLVMRHFENTILDETLQTVVQYQIQYGKARGVPWGISEAGYNTRDLQLNYQYGPFGLPGLGLKRGLSQDLVISPYSTVLAAQVAPKPAVENLKRLIQEGLFQNYGFFEAVDYTHERLPEGKSRAVIRSFMAHHQGMSIVAINNVLHENRMQRRFHAAVEVQTTQLLLQERIPQNIITKMSKAATIELDHQAQIPTAPFQRTYSSPHLSPPPIQLLSNGQYSLMASVSGSGYARCGNDLVYRWREDATRDQRGQFIYIRDLDDPNIWSAGFHPTRVETDSYRAILGEDKVEISNQNQNYSTKMEIVVSPEDNVEIRQVTVTNHTDVPKRLEFTSYLEPVLAPANADAAHPAFSKLFLQTEYLSSHHALLAKRRRRSEHDKEVWGIHQVNTDSHLLSPVEYETDRARFLGRGRSTENPSALLQQGPLSGTTGNTLDPIFSLRAHVHLPPGQSVRVYFTTGLARSEDEALQLADRYFDTKSFDREKELAWTKSRIDLFHLGLDAKTAYLYQRLAEMILFSDPYFRPPSHQLAAHLRGQSSLWPYGISGDLPIVALRLSHIKELSLLKELLRAHEYLRLKGLAYDFVVINEQRTSYLQELQDEIMNHIKMYGGQTWLNKPGGFFCLRGDALGEKDKVLILSVARVLLSGGLGTLKEQIDRRRRHKSLPPSLIPAKTKKSWKTKTPERKPEALQFFNGLGGFNARGDEYIIHLNKDQWTPAPWLNVIANKSGFGFQVSESGSSYSWNLNSRENRLTPWSNDPVTDLSGEVLYIRDEESGEFWTPTPLPIRESQTYTIQHGFGYTTFTTESHGLSQSLTEFVAPDDAVKVSILKIKNDSDQKRELSVTSYIEWVLGVLRENSAPYITTEWDQASSCLLARNPFNNEFGELIAFHAMSGGDIARTCDRQEFLGRNGNLQSPAAMKRVSLSGNVDSGHDPCAVLQTKFSLQPQEEKEIILVLGQATSPVQIRKLVHHYLDPVKAWQTFNLARDDWRKRTQKIQIQTPDASLNLLLNGWLVYQTLSCRFLARTAFYQSGGAYGFRDQLQDCMALVYSEPALCREHILKCASRQFVEGDVQHWWHPPSGRGVRTRMVDDLLWLPLVVHFYIEKTGDLSVLDETVPFLKAPLLAADQEDSYTLPLPSGESASLLEHCLRAVDHSLHQGVHGLPLIGTGDWNDGMNRVGHLGKGESVWMGWFLSKVLKDFLTYCQKPEQNLRKLRYEEHLQFLKTALEKEGWDGEWYRRAYFDDGTPLGSAKNQECRIDSIPQSWAVLSGAADSQRQRIAMENVDRHLIQRDSGLVLLFTPPFDQTTKDPGYIKGYVPGVRENGGQYTHAAIWAAMAFAQLGDGNRARDILNLINPIHHTGPKDIHQYKLEPYVVAADVYSVFPHIGRGGWSWYTGSASWFYRAALETILGFQLHDNRLTLRPSLPSNWRNYSLKYVHGSTTYQIRVESFSNDQGSKARLVLDGKSLDSDTISLFDDGGFHEVTIEFHSKENKPMTATPNELK